MNELRKAAEMALEALMQKGEHHPKVYQAAEALRQALAKPDFLGDIRNLQQLYTAPPASKPWVGLTDAEIGIVSADIWGSVLIAPQSYQAFAHAIEAKLKGKNA
jgi:hypothetical protein